MNRLGIALGLIVIGTGLLGGCGGSSDLTPLIPSNRAEVATFAPAPADLFDPPPEGYRLWVSRAEVRSVGKPLEVIGLRLHTARGRSAPEATHLVHGILGQWRKGHQPHGGENGYLQWMPFHAEHEHEDGAHHEEDNHHEDQEGEGEQHDEAGEHHEEGEGDGHDEVGNPQPSRQEGHGGHAHGVDIAPSVSTQPPMGYWMAHFLLTTGEPDPAQEPTEAPGEVSAREVDTYAPAHDLFGEDAHSHWWRTESGQQIIGVRLDEEGHVRYFVHGLRGTPGHPPDNGQTGYTHWEESLENGGYWMAHFDPETGAAVLYQAEENHSGDEH